MLYVYESLQKVEIGDCVRRNLSVCDLFSSTREYQFKPSLVGITYKGQTCAKHLCKYDVCFDVYFMWDLHWTNKTQVKRSGENMTSGTLSLLIVSGLLTLQRTTMVNIVATLEIVMQHLGNRRRKCDQMLSLYFAMESYQWFVSTTKQPKVSGGWLRTLTWCYWWVWSSPEDRSYLRSCSGTETSCSPHCPAETSSPGPGSHCPSALPLQQSCARVWSCRLGWRKKNQ